MLLCLHEEEVTKPMKYLSAALLVPFALTATAVTAQQVDPNDFTVRIRPRWTSLPHPLTKGKWEVDTPRAIRLTSEASYDQYPNCYRSWNLPEGRSEMRVGPGNLDDICPGAASVQVLSGDLLMHFRKLSTGADPPPVGDYTDCVPEDALFTFDYYRVKLCYETPDGKVGQGRPKSIGSSESGLIWFFSRDNIELLIKVLNGCSINGHRWVYVAPATDVAFNLYVEKTTDGTRWVFRNRQGAQSVGRDTEALECATAASSARTETVIRRTAPPPQ